MAEQPSSWAFRYVAELGTTTDEVRPICEAAPLEVTGGYIPVGEFVWTAPELANPASKAVPYLPLQDQVVYGPYIRIRWSLPLDITGEFEWDGRIRILRGGQGFIRDAESTAAVTLVDFGVGDYGYSWDAGIREVLGGSDNSLAYIDHDIVEAGRPWYYTIFFGNGVNSRWALSQAYCLGRAYAYTNNVDGTSQHGEFLYGRIPPAIRSVDRSQGDLALYRIIQAFGRMFDLAKDELDQHLHRWDLERTDAGNIPYLDDLLGWPTGYERSEDLRRVETAQAVTIWKSKGTAASIELALQTATGWDVSLVQGRPWVITTFTEALDPEVPPSGWVEEDDGVWAEIVQAVPVQKTFDPNDPAHLSVNRPRTSRDGLCYTPTVEEESPFGTGQRWQNLNGVLIKAEPVAGVSGALLFAAIRRIGELIPYLLPYYAAVELQVALTDSESLSLFGSDSYADILGAYALEEWAYVAESAITDSTPDLTVLFTYPAPSSPELHVTGSLDHRTFHGWLGMVM